MNTKDDDRTEFQTAYDEWMKDTQMMSTMQFKHPAYLRILAMGERAVPFIYEKIKAAPDPVVAALDTIIPNVVVVEGYCSMAEICEAWCVVLELTKGYELNKDKEADNGKIQEAQAN